MSLIFQLIIFLFGAQKIWPSRTSTVPDTSEVTGSVLCNQLDRKRKFNIWIVDTTHSRAAWDWISSISG